MKDWSNYVDAQDATLNAIADVLKLFVTTKSEGYSFGIVRMSVHYSTHLPIHLEP